MLEDFADNRSDRDTSVVVQISLITMTILDDRNNCTGLELARNILMHQHSVEEALESLKERQWSIEEMLCMNRRVIACFSFLHAKYRINDVFESNPMRGARAAVMTTYGIAIFCVKLAVELVDSSLVIWLRDFHKMRLERIRYPIMCCNSVDDRM